MHQVCGMRTDNLSAQDSAVTFSDYQLDEALRFSYGMSFATSGKRKSSYFYFYSFFFGFIWS